jgi:hypothetical protein
MITKTQEKHLAILFKDLYDFVDVFISKENVLHNDTYILIITIYGLTKEHLKKLNKEANYERNVDYIGIPEYNFTSLLGEGYWLILNKLAEHKNWTPITILDKVKELGMICFNNDKNNHPIDWLYNEYLNER